MTAKARRLSPRAFRIDRKWFERIARQMMAKSEERPKDKREVLGRCPLRGCSGQLVQRTTYSLIPDPLGRIPGQHMGYRSHTKISCDTCRVRFDRVPKNLRLVKKARNKR